MIKEEYVSSRKRILFVSNNASAMLNFRKGLLQTLIEEHWNVYVLAPVDDSVVTLGQMGVKFFHFSISASGTRFFLEIGSVAKLIAAFYRIRPSIVFSYTLKANIYASIVAKIYRVPSISVVTGLGYAFLHDNLITKIARSMLRFACRYPQRIFFLNKDDLNVFLKEGLATEKQSYLLDSEGINLRHFSPRRKQCLDSKFKFLMVSRFVWDKGVMEFVEACDVLSSKYKNVVFQIVGNECPQSPGAIPVEQIEKWKERSAVEFLGAVADVRPVLSNADCVVLPSYREGVPRALMEGAAMGKVLISTNVEGCVEVVEHGRNGFLCDAKSVESLVGAMEQVIRLPASKIEEMGRLGHDLIHARFDEELVISRYQEEIKKIHKTVCCEA